MLNTDVHRHFPSVPLKKVVREKLHFIVIIFTLRIHTEDGMAWHSNPLTEILLSCMPYFFPSVGVDIVHFYALVSLISLKFVVHDFLMENIGGHPCLAWT